jgi:hypothetical protein
MRFVGSAFTLLLLGALVLTGCGANDNPFNLEVKNNSSETVLVKACNGYSTACNSAAYTLVLRPRQSAATGQDPDGIFRPMMVTTQSGARLGCLPFQFSQITPPSAVVKISQMVPCGHSLGGAATGGRDWPFHKY